MKSKIFISALLSIILGGGLLFIISFSQKQEILPEIKPVISYEYTNPKNPVSMLFTGDVMLDRYMRKTIKKRGYEHVLLPEIVEFFQQFSTVIINHEGVMSGKDPFDAAPNMVQFTFPDNSTDIFNVLGVTHANLGNNHSRDFGKDADIRTRKILLEKGIDSYGSAFNEKNISIIFERNGYKIALVSYNDVFPENFEGVIAEIKTVREQVDILIVTTHWGIEYYSGIEEFQQEKAHDIIDAGADIIVGNHPHVVAPIEQYKNGIIFYSLGNFIFDQVFSDAVMTGLLLSISFHENRTIFRLFPTQISEKFQISFLPKEDSKKFLTAVGKVSKLPIETYGEVQNGRIHWRGFKKNVIQSANEK